MAGGHCADSPGPAPTPASWAHALPLLPVQDPTKVLITSHASYFLGGLITACVLMAMLAYVLAHFSLRLW